MPGYYRRMARGRRPEDWQRDLDTARASEDELHAILAADPRLENLENHTLAFDRLDFSFIYAGLPVELDLKEKRSRTSEGLAGLWPEVPREHLFVLDETVYRRVVWHGGGGYLVVHDHPGSRWAIFGPWELTLGPRRRYERWETRLTTFKKGKILLDLRTAAHTGGGFSVDALLQVVGRSRAQRDQVDSVAIPGEDLPEIGP
jgi:hypothetical protein